MMRGDLEQPSPLARSGGTAQRGRRCGSVGPLRSMFDPDDFHHGAVDPVADDVWSEGHEFTYISTNLTASMWLVRQALNGRHQAKGEPVGGQGRELANIGADALQVAARSRRPDHPASRHPRFRP